MRGTLNLPLPPREDYLPVFAHRLHRLAAKIQPKPGFLSAGFGAEIRYKKMLDLPSQKVRSSSVLPTRRLP